jgi:hypothetical protein
LADDKKPAFDPDKTVVDVPRPPSAGGSREKGPAPAAPSESPDKTVVMRRPATTPPGGAPADSESTMVGGIPRPAVGRAADVEKTMVGGVAPVPSGPAGRFELIGLSGSARGRRFLLRNDQSLIGSASSCQVVVPGIDAAHARIEEKGDGAEIQNLGAEGSVNVGGRRSPRSKLKSGDLVKVGDVVFRFVRVGDVFSSDYSESELAGGGLASFLDPEVLKRNWRYGAILLLIVVFALVVWPAAQHGRVVVQGKTETASDVAREKQVVALLTVGETLFNAGKYIAPQDQPEAENAYAKFNEILSLDPGNEKARLWLTRIDKKLDEERANRDAEEKRKAQSALEQKERQRKAVEDRVKALIEQGDQLYNAGQVAEPAGRNALVFYREALKVDDQSPLARAAVAKGIGYYVDNGDKLRESGDTWKALEQYRKASRASEGKDPDIEARVRETETVLKSGMGATGTYLVMYKDDRGQVVVLDEMDKVPARYRDRAVEIRPVDAKK